MDDLVKRLSDNSRYSQGDCLKCAKGFENHEYHCWGPETEGCLASQPELHKTVKQWMKERKEAAARIAALEAENARLVDLNATLDGWIATHRHVKTGGDYEQLAVATMQTSSPIGDMEPVVVYRSIEYGAVWVRPVSEFEDGRFSNLRRAKAAMEGK